METENVEFERTAQKPLTCIVDGARLKDANILVFKLPLRDEESDRKVLLEFKEAQKLLLKFMGESDEEIKSEFKVNKEIEMICLICWFKNIHWIEPK